MDVHNWITGLKDLKQFLSVVILSAPDDFPQEDYLSEDEQLNLERSFNYIRKSFSVIPEISENPDKLQSYMEITEQAYREYELGEVVKGAKLLQEMRSNIEAEL